MANEILGKGWKFPIALVPNESERTGYTIADADGEESIRDAIRLILSTAKGERVMRPDFGCGIHDHVFEVVNTTTVSLIKSGIADALRDFEPRIEVTSISVGLNRLAQGILEIRLDYRVIQTNNQFNLVYPFFLTEAT